MCFSVSSTHPTPQIAKTHLLVWKILTSRYAAPYQGTQYYPGELNTELRLFVTKDPYQDIFEGYHAYISRAVAKQRLYSNWPGGYVVCPAIIPKGSTYYINPAHGEIVASNLVVFRNIPHLKQCSWITNASTYRYPRS